MIAVPLPLHALHEISTCILSAVTYGLAVTYRLAVAYRLAVTYGLAQMG